MADDIKEDLISKLPVELLHEVFYWLPTQDAIHLSHANQALRDASLHRDFKLREGLKERLELTISQCGLGHMIEGGTAQAPYRSFYYQIFPRHLDPEVLIKSENDIKIRQWKDSIANFDEDKKWRWTGNFPKPEELLDDVPRLLKFFTLRMLTFDSIIFGAAFLDTCQKVFKGAQLSNISFNLCSDLLNPLAVSAKRGCHMETMLKFVESVKSTSIFFGECSSFAKKLIDDKFIARTAAAAYDKEKPLRITISGKIIREELIVQCLKALVETNAACHLEMTRGNVLDRDFHYILQARKFPSEPTDHVKWKKLWIKGTDGYVYYSWHHMYLIFENFEREK